MANRNIVLIGFMGSGKSVAARELAARLNRDIISTDELIEQKAGSPIGEIFDHMGETYFRRVERDIVAEIAKQSDVVIDCGGGVVLNPENIDALRKKGTLIYLSASAATIYERVKEKTHRPLLNVDDPQAKIKELLNERQSHYEAAADYTIDTNGKTNEQVCDELLEKLDGPAASL